MSFIYFYLLYSSLIISFSSSQSLPCSSFTDCYNCTSFFTSTSACIWSNNQCSFTMKPPLQWYDRYSECEASSNALQYCMNININTIPLTARLVDNQGVFGTENIYCEWKMQNNKDKTVHFNFTRYENDINDNYALYYRRNDGNSNIVTINDTSTSITLSKTEYITFKFFSNSPKHNLPFAASFSYDEQKSKAYSYIIVFSVIAGIILLCAGLCALFCLCSKHQLSKRLRKRNERRQSDITSKEDTTEINIFDINKFFNTQCFPMKYDSQLNAFGSNCTICLEGFKEKTRVIKLTCGHLFHEKCIKEWCNKELKGPKCPNCNEDIIKKNSKISMKNTNIGTAVTTNSPNVIIISRRSDVDGQSVTGRSRRSNDDIESSIHNNLDSARIIRLRH